MGRKARFTLPGIPQHVIQRGNNKDPCFFSEDDYLRYINEMVDASLANQVKIHAYVLMTNHVHLLLTPVHANGISHMMQDIGRSYVQYINRVYSRTGTLWEGRYKAGLVDSESYLLTCMRYIELNPVRAFMVEHPEEYRWSSYAANANGKGSLVEPHAIYKALGRNRAERLCAYRGLFRGGLGNSLLQSIRESVNRELVLGGEDFKDEIALVTKRRTRAGAKGRPRIEPT